MLNNRIFSRFLCTSAKKSRDSRPEFFKKLSCSHHKSDQDHSKLSDLTVNDLICNQAYNENISTIFHNENVSFTWSEIYQKSSQLADSLTKLGLENQEPLAIWSPNLSEWVITQFAAARANLPLVTLNPLYTGREVEELLKDINCRALISPVKVGEMCFQEYVSQMVRKPKFNIVIDPIGTEHGDLQFKDLLNSGNRNYSPQNDIKSSDLNMIQFTSGTTGKPKAAALTNHNVVNNAIHISNRIGASSSSKIAVPVPLFHCFGNVIGTLVSVHSSSTLCFPNSTWSAEKTIEAIEKYELNVVYGVPTMFIDMLAYNNAALRLKSLKQAVGAGSLLPPELLRKLSEEYNIKSQVVYGTTENSPVVSGCYLDDPFDKQVNTVGRALDQIDLKIIDPNTGITCVLF